jgi:hypothetical protein
MNSDLLEKAMVGVNQVKSFEGLHEARMVFPGMARG